MIELQRCCKWRVINFSIIFGILKKFFREWDWCIARLREMVASWKVHQFPKIRPVQNFISWRPFQRWFRRPDKMILPSFQLIQMACIVLPTPLGEISTWQASSRLGHDLCRNQYRLLRTFLKNALSYTRPLRWPESKRWTTSLNLPYRFPNQCALSHWSTINVVAKLRNR